MTVYGYRKEKSFVSYPLLDQDQSLGKFYLFYIKPSLALTYNDGHGFYGLVYSSCNILVHSPTCSALQVATGL